MALFRLAWDMTLSGFGARQELYERFFFGDPVRMYQTLFGVYDKGALQGPHPGVPEGQPGGV